MNIADMIENGVRAAAGETLLLTDGEYDSYSVAALVRVRRNINLRLLADAFIERERIGMQSPERMFSTQEFVEYMVSEDAVEHLPFREVQVAGDMDCYISSPKKDWQPEELKPLPYEWAEAIYDTPGRR